MAKFVWDGSRMVNKETGEPMVSGDWVPSVPQVIPDIDGYQSPIDGKWVEGRRARRYDLERSNSVDAREFGTKREARFRNERFIAKHKLDGHRDF
jgi:hypothetical protein